MKTYGRWLHHSWPWHQMEVSGQLHSVAVLPYSKSPKYPVNIKFPVILNTLNSFTKFHTKLHRSHSPKMTNLCPRILLSPSSESRYEEFRIWGSHGGSYECYHLLGYCTVCLYVNRHSYETLGPHTDYMALYLRRWQHSNMRKFVHCNFY
jgi:hypothetical protein